MKEEMATDAKGFPGSAEVSRAEVAHVHEKTSLYIDLLDQLGWSDGDDGSKEITVDAGFARAFLEAEIKSLGEAMLVATGHYESEDLDLAEVRSVGNRAVWLVSASEAFGVEEVPA